MPRQTWLHRSPSRTLIGAVAFLLMIGLLSPGPAAAHTVTKADGDDTRGLLDLRSASVSHKSNAVVHGVRTFSAWKAKALGRDSSFVVAIDKNDDQDYERCAYIFFAGGRLRGAMTNCGKNFIRNLAVSKPSPTTAKITIPKVELGGSYRWAVFSFYFEARPCLDGCIDVAPNRYPLILHDLTPPVVDLDGDLLAVWDGATTPDFVFPFFVSDEHTDVTWSVQNRVLGATAWTTVSTGTGDGDKDPAFTDVPPGQYEYRVVATDSQGNVTNRIRSVHVPTDVDADTGPGVSIGGVDTDHDDAYRGSYVALDETESYSIALDHPGGPCRPFTVIGPGSDGGAWTVNVYDGAAVLVATITSGMFLNLPRQAIYTELICADTTRVFTVLDTDGSGGFGIDAVLI